MTAVSKPERLPTRRSPLQPAHNALGAQFAWLGDLCVVDHYGAPATEAEALAHLGLADLCVLPRGGCKGRGAPGYLEQAGLELPDSPNKACRQTTGVLLARLSAEEFLLLPALDRVRVNEAMPTESFSSQSGVYRLPRGDSHGWLLLGGRMAESALGKLCGVDLRDPRFANHAIAQTSLARVNAIVIRDDIGLTPAYHLLADISVTRYLWDCLMDAMDEYGGRAAGWAAIDRLQGA